MQIHFPAGFNRVIVCVVQNVEIRKRKAKSEEPKFTTVNGVILCPSQTLLAARGYTQTVKNL
jgi:hypothetical protein